MPPTHLPFQAQINSLGEERLRHHMELNALMSFNLLALNLSVFTCPQTGYADPAIDAVITDCADLVTAATNFATATVNLAEAWRLQRQATESLAAKDN